jgi:hypothetical protein
LPPPTSAFLIFSATSFSRTPSSRRCPS